MRAAPRIALGALCIAVAAVAALYGYRLLRADRTARAASAAPIHAVPPAEVAPASASAATPGIPDRLPNLSLPDRNGVSRSLTAWQGKPLLLNFWATWCEPCRREIPLLKSLERSARGSSLQIVGVAVDERDPALKYAQAMHIDYPILVGGLDAGLAVINALGGEQGLPFSLFVDSAGAIVAVKVGELHPDEARYILARLDAVDSGRLSLSQARSQIPAGLRELAIARAKADASTAPE